MNDNLQPTPDAQARQWAMLCHYAAFFWVRCYTHKKAGKYAGFLLPMVCAL